MAGQTETLNVPAKDSVLHPREPETEEVVAMVETGDQQNGDFILPPESTDDIAEEEMEPVQNVAEVIEQQIVEQTVIDNVVATATPENPATGDHVDEMETEDIPSDNVLTNNTIVEPNINQNIPEVKTNEDIYEKPVITEPVNIIPEAISEEATNSVHDEQSTPDDNSTEVFHPEQPPERLEESPPPPPYSSILTSVVESTITTEPTITTRTTLGSTTIGDTVVPTLRTTITTANPVTSSHYSQIPKPPLTDVLLQTAREVLQLPPEEPGDVKAFLMQQQEGGLALGQMAGPVVTETVISSGQQTAESIHSMPGQRLSMEEEQHMEVSDENATYILEPVTNEEYYQDDQNIMWIQETVEVEQQESYDSLPNMVIILNPNGTVNEELMLAHGMNLETIKAVTDNVISLQGDLGHSQHAGEISKSITALQHPLPRRDLIDVKPLFANQNQAPRSIVDVPLSDSKQGLRSIVEGCIPVTTEHSRSVILDAKDNFLVLDELEGHSDPGRDPMIEPIDISQLDHHSSHKIIRINGTNHIITNSQTVPDLKRAFLPTQQLKDQNGHEMNFQVSNISNLTLPLAPSGAFDLSLPKKPDPSIMEQYVASLPSHLPYSLAQLQGAKDPLTGKLLRPPGGKVRKPKPRDENGNGTPYIHRKTTSLGALGQALHGGGLGIPRDSRENAVQICPICKFQATTKNPYRHLQDHLARMHFKDRIAADLPTKKPYICPMAGCDGKHYPDWQAVMRHYIGKKHGILDKFVKETLSQGSMSLHAALM